MPRAVLANCFVPDGVRGDFLLTDEPTVTAQIGVAPEVVSPETLIDPQVAHAASISFWQLAYSWFLRAGEDPTMVAGVSVGDLAGLEAAIAVLGPAARAVLGTAAALTRHPGLTDLTLVVPEQTPGGPRYDRTETTAAEAAEQAARVTGGEHLRIDWRRSADPRNLMLRDKYARTRDPQLLLDATPIRTVLRGLYMGANAVALLRRRHGVSMLVVEYNPTLGFSRAYAAQASRRRLIRWLANPREALPAAAAGDLVGAPPTARRRDAAHPLWDRMARAGGDLEGEGFEVVGVPLWPVVGPRLLELLSRYAWYAERSAPRLAAQLRRHRVEAVVVPYDANPGVRLLIRVAQSLKIPTFVVNDGYKGDEIQVEGMTADVALAWSSGIAEHYFRRRRGATLITGNPKLHPEARLPWRAPGQGPLRILVGSFTFSPVDLNCRRGDAERFLTEILAGIEAAGPSVSSEVIVKLHPADEPAHLRALIGRHGALRVQLLTTGDVIDLFEEADVYITTFSTSLLEAAQSMPVVYYRVNQQRTGAPFDPGTDEYLTARTASSTQELVDLLADRTKLAAEPPAGWLERYLGKPATPASIGAAIEAVLCG